MNKKRRQKIAGIEASLQSAIDKMKDADKQSTICGSKEEFKSLLLAIRDDINTVLNDEQDYFDGMPENLQGSMRGEESEDAIDNLESTLESLDDALEELSHRTAAEKFDEIISNLEEAYEYLTEVI